MTASDLLAMVRAVEQGEGEAALCALADALTDAGPEERLEALRELARPARPYYASDWHALVSQNMGRRCVVQFHSGERVPLVLRDVNRRGDAEPIDVTDFSGPHRFTALRGPVNLRDEFRLVTPTPADVLTGTVKEHEAMVQ